MTQPQYQKFTIEQALALGTEHHQAGRLREAESIYRQILEQHPNHSEALHLLGMIAIQAGQFEAAANLIRKAILANPAQPHYHCNLGVALASIGHRDEAERCYRKAMALSPNLVDAHYNMGNLLRTSGRLEQAIESYRKAISLRPESPMAHLNLGNSLRELGRIDEAAEAYRQALVIATDLPVAHYNLGLMLLLQGNYSEAWPHYEWRTRARELGPLLQPLPGPEWDGAELAGKRILLQTEQGFGDAIQFARFVPMVAARGGRVTIRCHPELARLFRTIEGVEDVVSSSDPLPDYDVHRSLLSLPLLLGTTLQTIPAKMPYLRADPELSAQWRKRLAPGSRNVGLTWIGRRAPNPRRSIPLSALEPLSRMPDIRFVSLQKDRSTAKDDPLPAGMVLEDWTSDLQDFADTAALIDNLDLVITIDTAVAHLAGAMSKPTWVLLQFVPDWRWMPDRSDSPWYPTIQLFRQPRPGDWAAPVREIARKLQQWQESGHA